MGERDWLNIHSLATYQNLANLENSASAHVTIYCSEQDIIDFPEPKEGAPKSYYRFLGFTNARNKVIPRVFVLADDPRLHGKTVCQIDPPTDAYTLKSDKGKLLFCILSLNIFRDLKSVLS